MTDSLPAVAGIPASDPAQELAILVLAAGASTRLGPDKRLVQLAGEPLLTRCVRVAAALGAPVFVPVAPGDCHTPIAPGATLLHEPPPREGPLRALLHWLPLLDCPLLALAADLPLLDAALLQGLLDYAMTAPDAAAVVVKGERGLEPLCALYRPAVLDLLRRAQAQGETSLQRALAQLPAGLLRTWTAPDRGALLNVNDRAALQQARARAAPRA